MLEIPAFIIYIIFFIDFFIAFFFLTLFVRSKIYTLPYSDKKPEITFILPAYNCGSILERTVKSIKHINYEQKKIKIIIVDDGSKDNTFEIAKMLEKEYKNVKVFTKKNQGRKAFPINYGLKRAKTELVAVLDADTLLKQDMLEKAIPLFTNNTMAVTSRMKPLNSSKILEKLQDVEYGFAGFYRMIMGQVNSLSVAPAFTIFRREFFLKHGYFDTKNLTEDLEMGMRIQSKHYDIGYVASSYAITDVPSTFKKLTKQRLRWGYGTIETYRQYRKLFFNHKYGDLGVFVLPAGFLSIMIMSLVFLAGFYSIASWVWDKIDLVRRGWIPSGNLDLMRVFLFFTDLRIVLFIIAVLIGLLIFLLIRFELGEKIKLRHYALYLTVYLWMLGLFYIIAFFYYITGRKPKW